MWALAVILGLIFLLGGLYWALGLAILGYMLGGHWAALGGWIVGYYLDEKSGRIK